MGDNDAIKRTHLGLYEYQINWARENNINLSAETRDALDERMPAEAKP